MLEGLFAPVLNSFSQQFKDIFSTLNEYISASIPSVNYFKTIADSSKIQEVLSRSNLNYTKALDSLQLVLQKSKGDIGENMKEIVANFESGIRDTGDELLALQSEMRRSGQDTQKTRAVFTQLYQITGGSLNAQNDLAASLRKSSKEQSISMDKFISGMKSMSQDMTDLSIVIGDPTRGIKISEDLINLTKGLDERSQQIIARFLMAPESLGQRITLGIDRLQEQYNQEKDSERKRILMSEILKKSVERAEQVFGGGTEDSRGRALTNAGLLSVVAALKTATQLTEASRLGSVEGGEVRNSLERIAGGQDEINKTIKSQAEERRRNQTLEGVDQFQALKEGMEFTNKAMQGLGVVSEKLGWIFDKITETVRPLIVDTNKKENPVFVRDALEMSTLSLQEFGHEVDSVRFGLEALKDMLPQARQEDIKRQLSRMEQELRQEKLISEQELKINLNRRLQNFENLEKSLTDTQNTLLRMNVDSNTTSLFGDTRFNALIGDLETGGYSLSKEKRQEMEELQKSFKDRYQTIKDRYTYGANTDKERKEMTDLNNQFKLQMAALIGDLLKETKREKEKIDESDEREKIIADNFKNAKELIQELADIQKRDKVSLDDILAAIKKQQEVQDKLIKIVADYGKVPLIGDASAGRGNTFAQGSTRTGG